MPGLSGLSLHAVNRNGSKAGCLDVWMVVCCVFLFFFFLTFSMSIKTVSTLYEKEKFQDPGIYGQQLLELEVTLAKDLLTKPTNSQFLYHLNVYVSVRLRAGMGCGGSPERWSNTGHLGVKLYILATEDVGTFWATGTKCIFFDSEIIVCQILLSGLCSILFRGAAEKEAIDVKASIII